MLSPRRGFCVLICSAITATVLSLLPAAAQTWPQRPVRLIVTLGGGSGVDTAMRLLAERLAKPWGQPVVVDNRPGGDGVVAITAFIGANDDHVLLATPVSSLTAHPYNLPSMPYKWSDLLPIVRVSSAVIVIAVPSTLPVNSLSELVAMTRAQPGKLNWAGTTGAIDFLFAGFLKKNNLDMSRVPYRNPQDAANDLATGRIQVAEASLATLTPRVEAGTVKLIAVTHSTRIPMRPQLPTVAEAGYPELTLNGLTGLFGPQGMPLALRERIAADVREAAADPVFEERLTATGQLKMLGGPEEFIKSINEQRELVAAAAASLDIAPSR
jgi:tripartite-type tricarboxylate transporter receptor subunit TctC